MTTSRVFTRPNGEKYLPRVIGDKLDVDILLEAREAAIPVLLAGPPGSGKTACIEAAFGDELLTVTCHEETEASDFLGSWVENRDRSVEFVYNNLPKAMMEGRPLLVDDITLADPRALAVLYPAMDGRKEITITSHLGEKIQAEPGFFVVGCHNPGVQGAILTEALSSRFLVQIVVETDFALAKKLGIRPELIKLIRNLKAKKDADKISFVPQMREMLAFEKIAKAFGPDFAISNLFGLIPDLEREIVMKEFSSCFGIATIAPLSFNN